jgi:K+/H+ antiporter YhaU regulatory subunit KhtT
MGGVITLLIVLVVSITITKIASIALTHTGLSKQSARFQSRSAFTGVGFTTSESEKVVNHPLRRRILQLLMILGNAGIITGISSLIVSFVEVEDTEYLWLKILILITGVVLLWGLASSKWLERMLSNVVSRLLKRSKSFQVHDYASLLHLAGEYRISEIGIDEDHWLCGKSLAQSRIRDEGTIVLVINRKDGTFLGTPQGDTIIQPNDSLIVYGRAAGIAKLQERHKKVDATQEHHEEVEEQKKEVIKEKLQDTDIAGEKDKLD